MTRIIQFGAAIGALIATASAGAQQPNASVAAYGMGGNYAARANGYQAVAWNPAMLGQVSAPAFSFGGVSAGGLSGLHPIDLSTIQPYEGRTIPQSTKEEWLQLVTARGGQQGRAEVGATMFAMSVRNIAFQVATSGYADANLSPDAFEAVMFGNAGLTGEPRELNFAGSRLEGGAFTTGAVSIGLPTPVVLLGGDLTVGVTGKYIIGNAMGYARDDSSAISTDGTVAVRFPMAYVDPTERFDNGHGMGFDAGAAWQSHSLTLSLAVHNLVNNFRWDSTAMHAKLGTASFDGASGGVNFDDAPFDSLPASLRREVLGQRFARQLFAGVAWRPVRVLTVTADVRQRMGDGIVSGAPDTQGVGLEFRGLGFLPLRAGVSRIDGDLQLSAGTGIKLFMFEVGIGAARRQSSGNGSEYGLMVGVLSIGG